MLWKDRKSAFWHVSQSEYAMYANNLAWGATFTHISEISFSVHFKPMQALELCGATSWSSIGAVIAYSSSINALIEYFNLPEAERRRARRAELSKCIFGIGRMIAATAAMLMLTTRTVSEVMHCRDCFGSFKVLAPTFFMLGRITALGYEISSTIAAYQQARRDKTKRADFILSVLAMSSTAMSTVGGVFQVMSVSHIRFAAAFRWIAIGFHVVSSAVKTVEGVATDHIHSQHTTVLRSSHGGAKRLHKISSISISSLQAVIQVSGVVSMVLLSRLHVGSHMALLFGLSMSLAMIALHALKKGLHEQARRMVGEHSMLLKTQEDSQGNRKRVV